MRAPRLLVVAFLCAASIAPAVANHDRYYPPADATWVHFDAPVPCSAICPWWVGLANDLGINRSEACSDRFPPGSWDEVVVTAPVDADYIAVAIYPEFAWAVFICSQDGRDLAPGEDLAGVYCDNWAGPNSTLPIGCPDFERARVDPGGTYIIRAYNELDPFPVNGWYAFERRA